MKDGVEEITTATIRSYVLGVQRVIRSEFNVRDLYILGIETVRNILENRSRELRA